MLLAAHTKSRRYALRVALTYSSESRFSLSSTESAAVLPGNLHSTTDVTMPQSLNLDFQTGINPKTLLYGSVRWVNWKNWTVAPEGFQAIGGDLVKFDSDALTYRLGLGRQFTDAFAGAIEVADETARGDAMSPLVTYDGYTAVSIGGTYTLASGIDLSAGLAYDFLGDADVDANGVTAQLPGQPRGRRGVQDRLPILGRRARRDPTLHALPSR